MQKKEKKGKKQKSGRFVDHQIALLRAKSGQLLSDAVTETIWE